jgi:hypothetical protein
MSQARYAAESGVHRAGSYLLDGTYPLPAAATLDTFFDRTKSPVTCISGCAVNNAPVVLSATAGVASNYPDAAVETAFNTDGQGTLTAGLVTLTYKTTATLISMQVFDAFGGTQNVVQTWQIKSEGGLSTAPKATVEVLAMIEQPKVSANSYGAFATADTCDALYLHGNVETNSYDSSALAAGAAPTLDGYGGDIGTNGNMHIAGSVDVAGNMYSPKAGVGACTQGGGEPGLSFTGGGMSVNCPNGDTGSDPSNPCLIKLPKTVVYQVPTIAAGAMPDPTTTITIGDGTGGSVLPVVACAAFIVTNPTLNCAVAGGVVTLTGGGTDITMPNIVVNGGYSMVIQGTSPAAQNVILNSFGGAGNVTIRANKGTGTDIGQSVVLKVAGKEADGVTDMAAPFALGDWVIDSDFAYDAANLQITYGGTASFSMHGNDTAAATIYAPNAAFTLLGNSKFYGSIIAKTIDNGGTPKIYYDRRLSNGFWVAGSPLLGSFTWSRY